MYLSSHVPGEMDHIFLTRRKSYGHVKCVIFFSVRGNTFQFVIQLKKWKCCHTTYNNSLFSILTDDFESTGSRQPGILLSPASSASNRIVFFLEASHPIIHSKLGTLSLTAPGVLAKYAQANLPNTPCSNQIYLVRGTFKGTLVSYHVTLWLEYRQAKKKIILIRVCLAAYYASVSVNCKRAITALQFKHC